MLSLSLDSRKELLQESPLVPTQFLPFRAQGSRDASLSADGRFGCSTKLQEGFYHLAYQMKSVGNYFCFRGKALDNSTEGCAQVHAHHLDPFPTFEATSIRLQGLTALSLKDVTDGYACVGRPV